MKKHLPIWIFLAVFILVVVGIVYAFIGTKGGEGEVVDSPNPAWEIFTDSEGRFSALYPTSFSVNTAHVYTALGPEKEIYGVSFAVPESLTRGTNLSLDTYFSVETLGTSTAPCLAKSFLGEGAKESVMTENGVRYSMGRRIEGTAGSTYEEHVYVLPNSLPCTAVRYFIRSTAIGNYEPGAVLEFNRGSLISVFDTIRQSLVLDTR